jgi:PAS domain S-box-containing protein
MAWQFSPAMLTLVIIFLAAICLASSWITLTQADLAMRRELLLQAKMIAQAINVKQVKTLEGSEKDLTSPDYLCLKEQLAAIVSVNEKSTFIYLMGQDKDGSIYFLVDNEMPDSEDYSAPGDPFEEASPELLRVFSAAESLVEGPVIDQWGVWISALVPIIDPQNSSVIALLGIDYDAATWRIDVAKRAALSVLMIISSFLILSLMLVLWRNREAIKAGRAELLSLKEFNERIVQNAEEGIIVCDQAGIIEFVNPALAGMLGLDKDEMLGRSWFDFVPEELREKAREADAKRVEGHSERYRLELLHKSGSPVPVQISASPRYDRKTGHFTGSLAVMTDISNLLQAERTVRESEKKIPPYF